MVQKIRAVDIAGISLFVFSLFFGAGNLIFPIKVGYRVGTELTPAMIGFALSAIVLPGIVLWACTRVDGGLDKITEPLPKWLGVLIAIILYLIIGPFLGLPRFSAVAYTTIQPLVGDGGVVGRLIFSLIFFGVTLVLALNPAQILQVVGKIMAPVLVIVLLFIAAGAVFFPQGPVALPDAGLNATKTLDYFVFGFEEGYQTLNALGILITGIVIITAVHGLGLNKEAVGRYTMLGMFFGGIVLAVTFVALGYLGSTAHDLVGLPPANITGAEIAPVYADALYGQWGTIALAIVVLLASLTTAIGVITACGEYFCKLYPSIGYRPWAIAFTILSVFIANIGLGPLLDAAKPVLLGIYPVAMCIAFLSLVKDKMRNQRFIFMSTLAPVIPLGVIECAQVAGMDTFIHASRSIDWLPMFDEGFGWVAPALLFFTISMAISSAGKKNSCPLRENV